MVPKYPWLLHRLVAALVLLLGVAGAAAVLGLQANAPRLSETDPAPVFPASETSPTSGSLADRILNSRYGFSFAQCSLTVVGDEFFGGADVRSTALYDLGRKDDRGLPLSRLTIAVHDPRVLGTRDTARASLWALPIDQQAQQYYLANRPASETLTESRVEATTFLGTPALRLEIALHDSLTAVRYFVVHRGLTMVIGYDSAPYLPESADDFSCLTSSLHLLPQGATE